MTQPPYPPDQLFPLTLLTKPGLKRDGTDTDNDYYQDAQWTRWQRGRPRKMGGYRAMAANVTGPVRTAFLDSRAGTNTLHTFSPWGVQRLEFDSLGAGGAVLDRTPSGYSRNDLNTWASARMFSNAGSPYTALMCASTPDILDIASDVGGGVYYGDIAATAALAATSDAAGLVSVSGGCVVLQPFLFVYGSNGLIRNTIANPDLSVTTAWSGTFSNAANVAGTKVIKGLPVRGGGNSPAGLFWSLDSLIRVSFTGGTIVWRYDTVSEAINVLSKSGIIEADGVYYWPGVDRFFMYNGVVQELPNDMNFNWFFDNVNFAHRQKVWAMKVPRFGEIWWFFPFGAATECTHAICFNYKQNTWYDTRWPRTSGSSPQVFPYPVLVGGEDTRNTTRITYTAGAGVFANGMLVTGGTSNATGTVARVVSSPAALNLTGVSGTFQAGENISSGAVTGTNIGAPTAQTLEVVWQHEFGYDKILLQDSLAIPAYFETNNVGFPTGGPGNSPQGVNKQTRVVRIEPDFVQVGSMNVYVSGRGFAQSANTTLSQPYAFSPDTGLVTMREQRRLVSLIFETNVLGGRFEMGRTLVQFAEGDGRGG